MRSAGPSRARSRRPSRTAQVAQDACAAVRPLRPAGRSPVGDHREVQVVPDAGRHPRREEPVALSAVVFAGIHPAWWRRGGRGCRWGTRPVPWRRRVRTRQSSGPLRAGRGDRPQPPHRRDHPGGRGRCGPHAPRWRPGSAGCGAPSGRRCRRSGSPRPPAPGCVRDLLPGGEPLLEPGERPLGVGVRGVLRQDGRHDLVDDRQQRFRHESALLGPQPALHRPDALLAGRPHKPDPCRERPVLGSGSGHPAALGLITRIPAPRPMASDPATQAVAGRIVRWDGDEARPGLGVPDPHSAVVAGAGQQLLPGHRHPAHAADLGLVTFQHRALLPGLGSQTRTVPSLLALASNFLPGQVIGHTDQRSSGGLPDGALLPGSGVPDADRAVVAGAGQQVFPGDGDRAHRPDAALVAHQRDALLAGLRVPDPHRPAAPPRWPAAVCRQR